MMRQRARGRRCEGSGERKRERERAKESKRDPVTTNKEKNEERFSLRLHEVPCKGRSGEETLQRTMGDNMGQEEILRGKKGK